MWERGLKFGQNAREKALFPVAPHVGAWIEIILFFLVVYHAGSLPMWERGLKSYISLHMHFILGSLPMWERGLKFLVIRNL